MNREEIEAAAARAGVRITGWDNDNNAQIGPLHILAMYVIYDEFTRFRAWGGRSLGPSTESIDEALAAIAADIDEIASVRVPADDPNDTGMLPCSACGDVDHLTGLCADCLPAKAERTAEDERADVVAWLDRKGWPDRVAEGIEDGAHVGAAE